ncbi:uncharacterized protein [Nicotiana sylvestris]|uniref:uncharacterized protein n=1 Tax=Nicotiana sylvestris TaxID=4096 RepID=UPI00388CC0A4
MRSNIMNGSMVSLPDYIEFLQYKACKHTSSGIASVVQIDSSVTCVSQSSTSESWVIDSCASYHISDNKSLFTVILCSQSLPIVTMGNGSQTTTSEIGQASPLPSLPLDSVLYVPGSIFNLIAISRLVKSLKCSDLFLDDIVFIQEHSTGWIIGTKRESDGFYYLILVKSHGLTFCLPLTTCLVTDSPDLLHKWLGHPSLSKLQKMVPGLSHLSTLESPVAAPPPISLVPLPIAPVPRPITQVPPPSPVQPFAAPQLLTYHRCPCLASSPSDSRPTSDIAPTADLSPLSQPIALCKGEALSHPGWRQAIFDEMSALYESVKVDPDGQVDRLKARLMAKGYTQIFGLDYSETFTPVAKVASLDIKNIFLYGDLEEEVYMEQPPGFIAYGESSGLYFDPNLCIYLVVCVDDIVITGNDQDGITNLKQHLFQHFQNKDLGRLKYFLGIEIVQSSSGSPSDRRSTSGYCVLVGGNLVSWKSKKQNIVARSNALTEYRAMAMATCELVWVQQLLKELKFGEISKMELMCNNQATLHIASNPVFHERTKHIEIDCHFEHSTGWIIGTKRESDGFYYLILAKSDGPIFCLPLTTCLVTDSPDLLHKRLGHPSLSKLQKIVPGLSHLSTLESPVAAPPPISIVPLPIAPVPRPITQVPPPSPVQPFAAPQLLTYHRCPCLASSPSDSRPTSDTAPTSDLSPLSQPIALHKGEALSHPGWRQAIFDELSALYASVKVDPDGQVDRLKARLMAKGYTQIFGLDYSETFTPVAKVASLDIKNIFKYGDLEEDIYIEQPPGFIAYGESSGHNKDLGRLKYFLGIEIVQSSSGIVISQWKYALDILEETGMMECRSIDTPMEPNAKLMLGQGEPLRDPTRYMRLGVVRILRYIKSAPGKGLLFEDRGHELIVGYTDADWTGSPSDRRSTSGYCILVGGNLVSWKSKKQNIVARSNALTEYRAMAMATCELVWVQQLLKELKFGEISKMELMCNNQATLHIASNPVFHERTKHIEFICHFVREKILLGDIVTKFAKSNDQLADIFTKSLIGSRISYICNKLGTYDLYVPA